MITMPEIVVKMNAYETSGLIMESGSHGKLDKEENDKNMTSSRPDETQQSNQENGGDGVVMQITLSNQITMVNHNVPDLVDQDNGELEDEEESNSESEDKGEMTVQNLRQSARIKKGILRLSRYAMHRTNIQDGKYNSKEQTEEMEQAKIDKVQLFFKDLEAVEPVHKEETL